MNSKPAYQNPDYGNDGPLYSHAYPTRVGGLYMVCTPESDFPCGSDVKSICLQCGRPGFNPWVGKIPLRRKWQPTPVFLPGKSHGQRRLAGYIVHGVAKSWTQLSDFASHQKVGIMEVSLEYCPPQAEYSFSFLF